MNVVAVNGSARKDGNTAILLGHALREIEAEGIATELVQLAGMTIRGGRRASDASPANPGTPVPRRRRCMIGIGG